MTAVLRPPPASPATPPVTWSDGVVVLRDESTFGTGGEAATARFLAGAFRVAGVVSVIVDRARATATIRHEAVAGGRAGLLKSLASAVRGVDLPGPPRYVRGVTQGAWTEYHRGPVLPACVVRFDGPGRLRLRLDALRRRPALALRVERLLETVPGVRRASAGSWLGRLLVRYDPAVLPRERLLELIGGVFYGPDVWTRSLAEPEPVRSDMANATLAVAVVGEIFFPALSPISAALLVATNLRTFRLAWARARQRRAGLPVLYTAIVATTLLTGQFVSSALMTWFFCYWNHRSRRELATARHRLLDSCMPLPGLARWLDAGGADFLVEAEHVGPGDRVVVSAGEAIPVDGRVVRGEAVVDERSLRGNDGATRKRPGDAVLAGSFVLSGELIVSAEYAVDQTRAAAIGRALVATTSPERGAHAPTRHAEAFAERAVGPTLATAGLGLLVGDLQSVGAILRPDYATGPGLGVPLAVLRDVAVCARRGAIVRDPALFQRLAEVDLLVFDDHPALARAGLEVSAVQSRDADPDVLRYAASAFLHLDDPRSPALFDACRARTIHLLDLPPLDLNGGVTIRHGPLTVRVREQTPGRKHGGALLVEINGVAAGVISFREGTEPEAVGVVRRLRVAGVARVAVVSERAVGAVARLAATLGANELHAGLGPDGKAAFLRECRERGLKTAFVADCLRNADAAAEAYVAISLAGDSGPARHPGAAAVELLGDRLGRLEGLWEAAHAHAGRARLDRACVVGPNLACVAGAFLFGFNGLAVVALSNFGTYSVYARATGSLRAVGRADRLRPARPHPLSN